jgi:hypothetical protein
VLLDCCFTAALLLLYRLIFFVLYCCFTAALLLFYCCLEHIQKLRILTAKHRAERDWQDQVSSARLMERGTQFTCFCSTKVQILQDQVSSARLMARALERGTQFTCFTSTKVQILQCEAQGARLRERYSVYLLY